MKAIVVYSSQSGNTKKLAEAVKEAMPPGTELYPVDQAPDPDGYDLVALGFWFQAGSPDPKSAAYLPKLKGQKLFLFATHGAAPESEHAQQGLQKAISLAPEAQLVGVFNCQGEVNPKVLAKVSARPDPPPWLGDTDKAKGHPDQGDLEAVKEAVSQALAG